MYSQKVKMREKEALIAEIGKLVEKVESGTAKPTDIAKILKKTQSFLKENPLEEAVRTNVNPYCGTEDCGMMYHHYH